MASANVEPLANDVLSKRDAAAIPVMIESVLVAEGVQVARNNFDGPQAAFVLQDESHTIIGVNTATSPRRQRFSLAHAFAHLRLHLHRHRVLIVDMSIHVGTRGGPDSMATVAEEAEANDFAAALLMPAAQVHEQASRLRIGSAEPDALRLTALAGSFDLVVSNPPYVRHGDIATLAPEVRRFDPPRALDGGADGLDGYRAIAADARRLISPSGILVVELGAGQRAPVTTLFEAAGLVVVTARTDLSGTPRALVVRALPGTVTRPVPGPVPRPVP